MISESLLNKLLSCGQTMFVYLVVSSWCISWGIYQKSRWDCFSLMLSRPLSYLYILICTKQGLANDCDFTPSYQLSLLAIRRLLLSSNLQWVWTSYLRSPPPYSVFTSFQFYAVIFIAKEAQRRCNVEEATTSYCSTIG